MPATIPRSLIRLRPKWLLFAAAGILAALALVAFTYPLWASPLARARLASRLGARLDRPVTIGAVDLGFRHVEVRDVVVEEPDVLLDQIVVDLSGGPLWPLFGPEIQAVHINGGHIRGSREQLESLVRSARGRRAPGNDEGQTGGDRPRPSISVRNLMIAVAQPWQGVSAVETTVEADVNLSRQSGQVTLSDAMIEAGGIVARAGSLTADVEKAEGATADGLFPIRVRVEDGGASLTDAIALADVTGTITLEDAALEEVSVDVAGTFSDRVEGGDASIRPDKLWSVAGRVRRDRTAGDLRLEMEAFELGRVPQVLAKLPVVESEGATVGGNLHLEFAAGKARVEGELELAGLHVSHPVLASTVVRDIGFALEFAGTVDPDLHRLDIEHLRVSRKGLAVDASGTIVHSPIREERRYDIRLKVPPVACQGLLDAVPSELIPSLEGFNLRGTFDMDVGATIDFADLEALDLFGKVGIWNCHAVRVPPRVSAVRLAGPFVHRISMKDGSERVVRLFPGSGTFTPLPAISPHMVAAVLTTEDGGFYGHRGFLPSQFEVALERNLRAGRVRLGASTITMQMVKNVLLSHERTVSRKLQEMFLTWYVERSLTKDRILEIYLNVVEYGPGIYGITRAAQHYFGKHPYDLNVVEAVYLALMLPSPVRRHVHYCRGELSRGMEIRLRRIIDIAHARERINDVDYALWKDWPIAFDLSDRTSERECLEEIERISGAEQGQQALSGLLTGSDVESLAETELIDPFENVDPATVDATGVPAMDIDRFGVPEDEG